MSGSPPPLEDERVDLSVMSSRGRGKGGKRPFRQGNLDEDTNVLNMGPYDLFGGR